MNNNYMQKSSDNSVWNNNSEMNMTASPRSSARMTTAENQHSMTTMNSGESVDIRSYQEFLLESIGKFMVCRFLIGTGALMTASGFLRNVGNDFFVLEDPCTNMMTTCDLYSVKFISVLPEEFNENVPSYCRRRLYENAPIFTSM